MHPIVTVVLLARGFVVVIACALSLHLLAGGYAYVDGGDTALALYGFFNLGAEQNLPTYLAVVFWLFAAVLCGQLAVARNPFRTARQYWGLLGAISLFISFDELVMLHERLTVPVREAMGTSGMLYQGWVIPYGLAALVVALTFLRFLLALPRFVGGCIFLSGAIYVSGALGFELAEGVFLDPDGPGQGLLYRLAYTAEETLELIGVALFCYALMEQSSRPVEDRS